MTARCERCRFYHANPPAAVRGAVEASQGGVRGGGECRHQPPEWREHELLACFPLVAADWWCGAFEEAAPLGDARAG